jgi:hypothetical protein
MLLWLCRRGYARGACFAARAKAPPWAKRTGLLAPTIASFWLVTTPDALDPPLPAGGNPFTAPPVPLLGLWSIGQAALTHASHAGISAYDPSA